MTQEPQELKSTKLKNKIMLSPAHLIQHAITMELLLANIKLIILLGKNDHKYINFPKIYRQAPLL